MQRVILPAAVFISAFLLFQVQPLIAKIILPWFGGTPAVWTTCMLFFQIALLAGYYYAYLLSVYLSPRKQTLIHSALIVFAISLLNIVPGASAKPTADTAPIPHILLLLTLCVGLPYFLLATTGPLLQHWFALINPSTSPYRLYAVSNAGSLLALLTYPVIFEPLWSVEQQANLWSMLYGLFAGMCIVCAWRVQKCRALSDQLPAKRPPELGTWTLWLILPACASALLLAVTNLICQDVAVIPFLWIAPLSLYLLSCILCFAGSRWYRRIWYMAPLPLLMLLLCDPNFTGPQANVLVAVIVSLSALFFSCMVCHGELAALKPEAQELTLFYLTISAGGAVGGSFVAIVAPLLFPAFWELHLSLFAIILCSLVVLFRDDNSLFIRQRSKVARIGAATVSTLLSVALFENARHSTEGALLQTRNFYGVLRLAEENSDKPDERRLLQYHGRILHGIQYASQNKRNRPTAYFGEASGIGLTLKLFRQGIERHIGIIGLGAGTLAAYGRHSDRMRFYEINPDVIKSTGEFFSYVQDSAAAIEIVPGDARLSLERETVQDFDVLVIDAFSGDAIPAHLLTREAFELYLKHLDSMGIIAAHITNNHLDLRPVLSAVAEHLRLDTVVVNSPTDKALGLKSCTWMMLSRNRDFLDNDELLSFADSKGDYRPVKMWTDRFSNLFSILKY